MISEDQHSHKKNLKLLSDEPIIEGPSSESDGLGFKTYAGVLGNVALQTPGPFTIGVFGEWGTGKTSLMRLIEEYLDKEKNVITVWFNAWRYESEDQPIVPLVATIIREIERNSHFKDKLAEKGKTFLKGLRAVAYGFSGKATVKIPGFAEIEASYVAKDMFDKAENLIQDPLLDKSLYYEAFQQLAKAKLPDEARIIILIDDLDRCFPNKAIRLLESIKLVLAQPGFIFFIGVARKVIEGYLQYRYEKQFGILGEEGKSYLDKIVQLPFYIPPHVNRLESFWDSVINRLENEEDKKTFKELGRVADVLTESNPRAIIRNVNNLLVDRAIFEAISGDQALQNMPIFFFVITRIIQQKWPDLFDIFSKSNENCNQIVHWMKSGISDEVLLPNNDLKFCFRNLQNDDSLSQLLKTQYGQKWLKEHERRNATIDYMQTIKEFPKELTSLVLLAYDISYLKEAIEIENILTSFGNRVTRLLIKRVLEMVIGPKDESDSSYSGYKMTIFLIGQKNIELIDKIHEYNSNFKRKDLIIMTLPGVNLSSARLLFDNIYKLNEISPEELSVLRTR